MLGYGSAQRWYILPKEQFLLHHVFQFSNKPIYIYIFPFLFMTKSDIQWLGHERMTRPFLKVC